MGYANRDPQSSPKPNEALVLAFRKIAAVAATKLLRVCCRLMLVLALLGAVSHSAGAQDSENPKHPDLRQFDTLALSQQNGPEIHIIGYGRFKLSYSETIDGYTLVRNQEGIYEYAERASGGDLKASGTIAHDPADRDSDEQQYLEGLSKHLRYRPPKLEEILKEQNRFFRLKDKK